LLRQFRTSSQLGTLTAISASATVFILCSIFEFLAPHPITPVTGVFSHSNYQIRFLIYYATTGGLHVIFCLFGTLFLLGRLKSEEPSFELRKIVVCMIICCSAILVPAIVACYLPLDFVSLSYDQIISPLKADPQMKFLMESVSIISTNFHFRLFAIYPVGLVALGIIFSVVACFWISHIAITFLDRAQDLEHSDIVRLKSDVTQATSLLGIVFTTSTITTVVSQQLGRDWIEALDRKRIYIQDGYAMSIFWSTCYTSILLSIILIPLLFVGLWILPFKRRASSSRRESVYYEQIYELVSLKFLTQIGAAILAPIFTSSLAAIIGS
jgi:hypothetical protein